MSGATDIIPKIVPEPEPDPVRATAPVHMSSPAEHDRRALREALLLQTSRFAPKGVTVAECYERIRRDYPGTTSQDFEREFQYLLDKGLLVDVPQIISPEIHHYRIHARGIDYLAEQRIE